MTQPSQMMSSRDAFGQTLLELGREYPSLLVLDADVGTSTKAATFASEFPERFLQIGIAEQNMIGIAAGLALAGWMPFTSTLACFASKRALDQVRTSVVQPGLNVKMAGAYSGLLAGKTGITHQSVQDVAIFRAMPGITILAPSDANETKAAIRAAVAHRGPVYVRLTRDPLPVIWGAGHEIKIGKAVQVRDGSDVALVTTGWMLIPALEAADALAARGVSVMILHVPTVKPLDGDAIVDAARRTGAVVTVEDHSIIGGLGSAVAEILSEQCPTRMRRIGICDCYAESAPNEDLLIKYGLNADNIVRTARALLSAKTIVPAKASGNMEERHAKENS